MADLLKRLQKQNIAVDYLNRILTTFEDAESTPPVPDLRVETETVDPSLDPKSSPARIMAGKIQNSLIEPLTNRELEILELLAQRLQNKEIAEKLCISPTTVKTHLQNVFQKLNATNRASFYFYNTLDEIDRLAEALQDTLRVFRRA